MLLEERNANGSIYLLHYCEKIIAFVVCSKKNLQAKDSFPKENIVDQKNTIHINNIGK